jgi:hypothetical protein
MKPEITSENIRFPRPHLTDDHFNKMVVSDRKYDEFRSERGPRISFMVELNIPGLSGYLFPELNDSYAFALDRSSSAFEQLGESLALSIEAVINQKAARFGYDLWNQKGFSIEMAKGKLACRDFRFDHLFLTDEKIKAIEVRSLALEQVRNEAGFDEFDIAEPHHLEMARVRAEAMLVEQGLPADLGL